MDNTFCNLIDRLCGLPQREIQSDQNLVEHYPKINLNCDALSSSSSASFCSNKNSESWSNVLIPVDEGALKRIVRTFCELGVTEALNVARESRAAASWPIISTVVEFSFHFVEFVQKLKNKVLPHKREQDINSVGQHAETRDWLRSAVRYIAWHPNCFKIAVAGVDDIVRIYSDEPSIVPVLKNTYQKWITCMAWRPYSAIELAVGCQKGICLWSIDSNMRRTRSLSQTVCLQHDNHSPISSLEWSKDGTLLASASISDTDILIWNIDKMQNTALKRVGYACSLLKWSPGGSCLFSSTVGCVFRVWHTVRKWQPERWSIQNGHIQSACWSPCSSFLLFVTSEGSLLYRLQFLEEQLFQRDSLLKTAVPICDLSKILVDEQELGGRPQCMAWDPSGLYLAIMFKDTPCIAIFTTSIYKINLTISAAGFIAGSNHNEYPTYITFQSKNRKNKNSVLTIGWSTGRIQYFPFI